MSGNLTVRPIQAHLLHDKDLIGKMDPYCIVHLGQYNIKGQVCKNGGRNPQWGDTINVQRNYEKVLLIELRDKDRFSKDDAIGVCYIDLSSLPANQPVTQWYPLQRWHSNAGEVMIELTFHPNMQQFGGQMGMQQAAYCPFKTSPYLSQHVQMTTGPAMGYQQPNYASTGFQQPMMQGGMQPMMQPGMQPMMQGGIQQPMMQGAYQQPMMQGGMQPMMQGGYQQPMMQGGMQPMMQGGIQQPMMQGGVQPMMQGGYQQPMYQQPRYF